MLVWHRGLDVPTAHPPGSAFVVEVDFRPVFYSVNVAFVAEMSFTDEMWLLRGKCGPPLLGNPILLFPTL